MRAMTKEISLDGGADESSGNAGQQARQLVARELTPDCNAALLETVDLTFRRLSRAERATLRQSLIGEHAAHDAN